MASAVGDQSRQTEITRPGSDWRTLLAVTITVFAWASAFVVIRYAAYDIHPGALALGRLLVASIALSVIMSGRKLVRMTAREWALTALVGVAWFAVYSVALNAGEQYVDAGTASMLIQFAPILIGVLAGILLGWLFLNEVPPILAIVGGALSLVGVAIARQPVRPKVTVPSGM